MNNKYKQYYEEYESKFNIKRWYDIRFNEVLIRLNNFHIENNIYGNILEIGTFLGLSFIPLSLLNKDDEFVICVDTFENYAEKTNVEKIFIDQLLDIRGTLDHIVILKTKSNLILNTINKFTRYRIISIDGGHSYNDTINDLNLSSDIIHDFGIIIVDDYENDEWPEIRIAVNDFLDKNTHLNKNTNFLHHNKLLMYNKKIII